MTLFQRWLKRATAGSRRMTLAEREERFARLRLKHTIAVVDAELKSGGPRRTTQEIVAEATHLACEQMRKEDEQR